MTIVNHAKKKAEEMKSKNAEFYTRINDLFINGVKTINDDADFFFIFSFCDFILIMCRILKYYVDLTMKIIFTEKKDSFILAFYGNEEQLSKLAVDHEYELRLRPYALKFQKYVNIIKGLHREKTVNEKTTKIQEQTNIEPFNLTVEGEKKDFEWAPLKYEELDTNNPLHWPPY